MDFSSFFDYPVDDNDGAEEQGGYIFLPQWGSEEWEKLLKQTQTLLYKAGETIFETGSAERALYIVAYGTLEVLVTLRGQERRIATILGGSVMGEQAFLDGKPRSATIRASTDCQILQLSIDAFEVFAAREPILARHMLYDLGRILSLRLRDTVNQLSQFQ